MPRFKGAAPPAVKEGAMCPVEEGTFKEPGSGIVMDPKFWYVLSDSGSCYTGAGFHTSDLALVWWRYYGAPRFDMGPDDAVVVGDDFDMGNAVNIVQGAQLRKFWLQSDPELFEEVQRELTKDKKQQQ
jgi:hypothetical protein